MEARCRRSRGVRGPDVGPDVVRGGRDEPGLVLLERRVQAVGALQPLAFERRRSHLRERSHAFVGGPPPRLERLPVPVLRWSGALQLRTGVAPRLFRRNVRAGGRVIAPPARLAALLGLLAAAASLAA